MRTRLSGRALGAKSLQADSLSYNMKYILLYKTLRGMRTRLSGRALGAKSLQADSLSFMINT